MSNSDATTDQFLRLIAETPGIWQSIDLGVVAGIIEGEYHNLITQIRLTPFAPTPHPSLDILASTKSLLGLRELLPIDRLHPLLESIRQGELDIGPYHVRYLQDLVTGLATGIEGKPYQNRMYLPASRKPQARLVGKKDNASAAHTFQLIGNPPQRFFDTIGSDLEIVSKELRAQNEPWDGLSGLLRFGLQTNHRVAHGTSTSVDVTAFLPASLIEEECGLDDGLLHVVVSTDHLLIAPYCSVGYVAMSNDGTMKRGTIRFDEKWQTTEVSVRGAATLEVDAIEVSIFLRVGSHVVDECIVHDDTKLVNSTRIAASNVFDPKLEVLKQRLLDPEATPNDKQHEFENALTRLFGLLGFTLDALSGCKRLTDAVDILAFDRRHETLLAIECTTGSLEPNHGKLGHLVQRTEALRRALVGIRSITVIPVIVTALKRASIADTAIETAQRNGIAPLCREDLSKLYKILLNEESVEIALSIIRDRLTPQTRNNL